jgi:hypothetical protein
VYRTAVADPDETDGDDAVPPDVGDAPTLDDVGVTASAVTAPSPASCDVTGAEAPEPAAVELEVEGRSAIASSGAARRSEKQYLHLIASSWIISAQ